MKEMQKRWRSFAMMLPNVRQISGFATDYAKRKLSAGAPRAVRGAIVTPLATTAPPSAHNRRHWSQPFRHQKFPAVLERLAGAPGQSAQSAIKEPLNAMKG